MCGLVKLIYNNMPSKYIMGWYYFKCCKDHSELENAYALYRNALLKKESNYLYIEKIK